MKLIPGARIVHLKLGYLASVVFLGIFSAMPIGLQQALAVNGSDGNLYVSSRYTDEVLRYDRNTGDFIDAFVTDNSTLNGGLNEPNGLVFGPDGHLYVASRLTDEVKKYNGATGEFMGNFVVDDGIGGMDEPVDLEFGLDGKLYVTSASTDEVWRYNGTNGISEGAFVSAGSGGLDEPRALTFGPDANLYVSSRGTNEILRYNGTTGASMGAFVGNNSTLNGGLNVARGLEFGPGDDLFVSSWQTDDVKRYNGTNGAFMANFTGAGSGGLNAPWSLLFGGPDGNLYVISHLTDEVLRYDRNTGDFIDAFVTGTLPKSNGGLNAPFDLAFAPLPTQVPTLSINDVTLTEGDSGTKDFNFTLTRSGNTTGASSVDFATADVTATQPSDYASAAGTVNFAAGETTKTATVVVNGDTDVESDETFNVNLSNCVNCTIADDGADQGVGTIQNDDVTPGDVDQDSVPDAIDNCPTVFNPNQADQNGNGIGDACEVVGGEILGVDVSALLVAGAFSNAYWMTPLVGVIVGSVIALVGLRRIIK